MENPQPGPSQRTQFPPPKRKGLNDGDTTVGNTSKKSRTNPSADKSKTIKGERKPGGLIINPLPSMSKGKGKEREVLAPTRQELEAEEDIRRMDAERERLRVREARAQARTQPSELKQSFIHPQPPSSRKKQNLATPAKVRSIDTTLSLPIRDTPTIERNRAMRGEPVERRTSLTRRGKRASSSFENKGIIPQPHASVSSSNFHKHIDRELPEAHRARHLLAWCASRTSAQPVSSDPPLPPLTAEGATMLREVEKEVQKMLDEQRIEIIFNSRTEEDGQKKPHEQNVKNLKREDDFMRYIEQCKREGEAWTSVIQSYNARQASTLDSLSRQSKPSSSTEWIPPDPSDPLYEREIQAAQLAHRCIESAARKRSGSPLTLRLAEVENKVDRVHSALHIAQQFSTRVTRHLDKRFEALSTALAARGKTVPRPGESSVLNQLVSNDTGPSAPDTHALLRALTRTDVAQQKSMGEAARKAARDVQRVAAAATPAGERRFTAVAPRTVAPGTPRRPGTPRQRSEGPDGGGG
ncbi:Mis12-Mtw1 protein family-domain-containing protein [Hysterangium stoloniferum]|nr:Mis12-Mtw1 protein family-domain-containing protein [Hysterangium stoloniferum]